MITPESNQDFKPRRKCFGDSAIIFGITKSELFKLIFINPTLAVLRAIGQFIEFTGAASANSQNVSFRSRFGIQSQGILLSLSSFGLAVAFNSEHSYLFLSPLVFISMPLLPFFYSWDTLYQWVFLDVRSQALLVYSFIILAASLVHVVMVYTGHGNKEDICKAGESWMYLGFKKLLSHTRLKVNEFFIVCFLECGITAMVGYLFWSVYDDQTFGLFCFIISFSEFLTQVKSKTAQLNRQAYLKAS